MEKINLQGGNVKIGSSFYELTFPFINENTSVLNLGCGVNFNFERALRKKKNVKLTSLDIVPCVPKPHFADKFVLQSVEKEFHFAEKFDVVTFFELIEHIDKTDILFRNCFNNLKSKGHLIFSFPNLSSLYARVELLLGYQPHILEVSNDYGNFGTGIFGKINNKPGSVVHHLRGITYRAMTEMVKYHRFKIIKRMGFDHRLKKVFYFFPSIAPVAILVCQKNI